MLKNSYDLKIKRLVAMAMFAALAYVIHFVHIPVGFLNLDFKDVVTAVCGMYFGPLAGIAIAVAVPVLEFLTVGTTGVYGLIMNVIGSVAFVGTASLIYRFKRTLSGAIVSLVSAVFLMTAVMMAANLLITPYYMDVSTSTVASLIPTLLLPFNAVKAVLNASLTMCVYKPLTAILRKSGLGREVASELHKKEKNSGLLRGSVFVYIIGGGIAVLSLVIIFAVLGGTVAIS